MSGGVEFDQTALLGALVAVRRLDSEARKEVAKATRSVLAPAWKNQLARYAANPGSRYPGKGRQQVMLGKGKVRVLAGGGASVVAWTGRDLSGGLATWKSLEFGSHQYPELPRFVKGGRVAYPASRAFQNTAAKTWLRAIAEACRAVPGFEDGNV